MAEETLDWRPGKQKSYNFVISIQRGRVGHWSIHNPSLRFVFRSNEILNLSSHLSVLDLGFHEVNLHIRFRGDMAWCEFGFPISVVCQRVSDNGEWYL